MVTIPEISKLAWRLSTVSGAVDAQVPLRVSGYSITVRRSRWAEGPAHPPPLIPVLRLQLPAQAQVEEAEVGAS